MAGCLFIQWIRFLSFVSMSRICPLLQLLLFPNHPENHAFLLSCPLQTWASLVCMTIFNGYGSFTWLSRFWYYLVLIYLFHVSFHCLSKNPTPHHSVTVPGWCSLWGFGSLQASVFLSFLPDHTELGPLNTSNHTLSHLLWFVFLILFLKFNFTHESGCKSP